jgi:hypothetical protein
MRYEVELTDEQAQELLRHQHCVSDGMSALVDAVRANPPKPPRMAEPAFGLQGYVTAHTRSNHTRRLMVRANLAHSLWTDGLRTREWFDLIDPEPVVEIIDGEVHERDS